MAMMGISASASAEPSAPAPTLRFAFSADVAVAAPVEYGPEGEARKRFIPITGGTVSGPRLKGVVLEGGGDWQTIDKDGLTHIYARYFLKADDGTVIEVDNPGIRAAEPAVIEKLARGEPVDPSQYYFRTTPRFSVADGKYAWLRRQVFVARGVRKPDRVVIDFYTVE